MASPQIIKDLVSRWEVTSDTPAQYGGSSPTWLEYKGAQTPQRISEDSEHPSEEPLEQGILDGRQVQAAVENQFQMMIFEKVGTDEVYQTFREASTDNTNVWIRRTGEQEEATAEIIGGKIGLTVTMGKQREGVEGHRLFVVNLYGVGVFAGNTIEQENTGS